MLKDDSVYVDHMLECINKIKQYCNGADWQDFENNIMLQDAVIRNIEIIGEASKKLSEKFRTNNKQVPWREIAGMRDKLIHDYFGVDVQVVWKTVSQDIPILENLIQSLNY